MSTRISSQNQAEANIGKVIQYMTKDGLEYGRIIRAVPSQIILERLQLTAKGFEPHPVPICPSSKNQVTFDRKILLAKEVTLPRDITKM